MSVLGVCAQHSESERDIPQGLADHHHSPPGKDQTSPMQLDTDTREGLDQAERKSRSFATRRDVVSVLERDGHCGADEERGRDRETFKVFRFSGRVLRDEGDGRVESCESGDTGADVRREDESVGDRAKAKSPRSDCRCNSERDLCQCDARVS